MAKETTTAPVNTKKSDTKIISHNCQNAFMDERYGSYMRVANLSAKGWRCCACGGIKGF